MPDQKLKVGDKYRFRIALGVIKRDISGEAIIRPAKEQYDTDTPPKASRHAMAYGGIVMRFSSVEKCDAPSL